MSDYGEVEFLDDPAEPDEQLRGPGPGHPPTHPRPRTSPFAIVAVAAWLAAAALCVAAPWQVIYRVKFPGIQSRGGLDGWGRVIVPHTPGSSTSATGHGARLGVILCACAVLLLGCACVAATLSATRMGRRRRSSSRLAVLASAVAAPAVVAGVAASNYLSVHASIASIRSVNEATAAQYGYGPFCWFCLAAIGCATVAALAWLPASRPGGGPDENDASEPQPVPPG